MYFSIAPIFFRFFPATNQNYYLKVSFVAKIFTRKEKPEVVKEELLNLLRESDSGNSDSLIDTTLNALWGDYKDWKGKVNKILGNTRTYAEDKYVFITNVGLSESTVYFKIGVLITSWLQYISALFQK